MEYWHLRILNKGWTGLLFKTHYSLSADRQASFHHSSIPIPFFDFKGVVYGE
jgi:hypothetical protein